MSNIDLLVRASHLYFELGETQERVAEILSVTRSQVSRLLKEARAEGIVEIRIIDPRRAHRETASQLQRHFDLKHVVLCPRLAGPEDLTRRMIAKTAAKYVRGLLREGFLVGVGGGATIAEMIDEMASPPKPSRINVIPLTGGIGRSLQANELARRLAHVTGGVAHELPAPALVTNAEVKEAMMAHTAVQAIVSQWHQLDVAVFGIGAATWNQGNLGAEIGQLFEQSQAVGEFLVRPFNLNGKLCAPELDTRTITIEPEWLARIPTTIAVAGGDSKVQSLLGALRGKFFKILVTDSETAKRILEEAH